MNSRELFLQTVNHKQPERLVVDLSASPVTGIHVQTVAQLRAYFGLEEKPVRVIEPFQMLGEVDDELINVMGIDIIGAWGKNNMFGIFNQSPFHEWRTPWGQNVLVPVGFNTSINENDDILIYPEGDTTVPASAKIPKTGYFFDAIIRQEPIVEEKLNIKDNLEEFGLISKNDLDYWESEVNRTFETGKAVIAGFGGTALGDIALVPGINLKNPKGIRDVAEWYISTIMRPDYIKSVFEKQVEKYGNNLVFWGGGVDTQKILPFGKPEDVREQVLRTCDIFAKDGGFVFNTVHNIQANVPVKNIISMLDAINEFNGRSQ